MLRACFISKYGMKHVVPPVTNRRIPLPPRTVKQAAHNFGTINYEIGPRSLWVLDPDPRPKVKVSAKKPDDQPSPLTKIAGQMYQHNRMPWDQQSRPTEIKPKLMTLNPRRKTNNAACEGRENQNRRRTRDRSLSLSLNRR